MFNGRTSAIDQKFKNKFNIYSLSEMDSNLPAKKGEMAKPYFFSSAP